MVGNGTRIGFLATGLTLVLVLGAASTRPATAQDADGRDPVPGPLVLKLSSSTRAMGLGGAFWAGDGANAVLHHPALIAGEGFGGSRRKIGGAMHLALSGSRTWLGGGVAAGISFLQYGTSARTPLKLPREVAALIGGGHASASEYVASLGFADELYGVDVGVAAKVVGQSLGGRRASTVAVDLGVARSIGRVTTALSVQNLGRALQLGRYDVPLARRVVVGAGTGGRAPVGPFDLGGAVQIAREGDGEIVPGGGLEVAWWPVQRRIFIVRIGAVRVVEGDSSPLTFGAGFEGDRIRIDWAYRDYSHKDLRAAAHSIGIAFR